MGKKQKKQKIILPPELPPEIAEDEVEVSDEDFQFVRENRDYAGFVSSIDTRSITKHVNRVADVKEDVLEVLYEKRRRKKLLEKKEDKVIKVDRVDALPVKTLDGKLYYRTVKETSKSPDDMPTQDEAGSEDKGLAKLTKVERRAKLKKSKRDTKKLGKTPSIDDDVPKITQSEVLAEVKEELSAEEALERKKCKLAEFGIALLADPESNIKYLKEMLQLSKDADVAMVKLGLLSLLAVFKDIVPGYRIRLPTEKEQQMTVSKAVRKMRLYESTLLSSYKVYLQKLMGLQKQPVYNHVAIRCICTLLEAVPHFNFRENLLSAVVKNISSPDDVVRKLCCDAIRSLFSNEGKHRGEATLEAVQMIADYVKAQDCRLHPDSIEVFLSLSFNEDLRRPDVLSRENRRKGKSNKRKRHFDPSPLKDSDKKRTKREMLSKTREEVSSEFKAASLALDVVEQKQMQSETLSAVFETYFRILKRTMQPFVARPDVDAASHPLLEQCLIGIGKFSHLINVDFMGDLLNFLKMLASADSSGTSLQRLTVSERLQCCIVAFKVMRSNLGALNIDLKDFHAQLYNLLLESRRGRDEGQVLVEALKTVLCEDRQHDMQRAAAFAKRLATFALCFGSAESMAALVTLKHLLQKNVKCQNLLENDAGGGSVSGCIAKFQVYARDPSQSGALASVLWELPLLSKHYHPRISALASEVASMTAGGNPVCPSSLSPLQVFLDLSLVKELGGMETAARNLKPKKKRAGMEASFRVSSDVLGVMDEDAVREKLKELFIVLHDIAENERLRTELDRTNLCLRLYEEFSRQKESEP